MFLRVIGWWQLNRMHHWAYSAITVRRRRKNLGLMGSGTTTRTIPDGQKRQLIFDQMAKDPSRNRGPAMVKEAIAKDEGIHLTR